MADVPENMPPVPTHMHVTNEAAQADRDLERQVGNEKVINNDRHTSSASVYASIAKDLDWDGPDDPGNPYNWPVWQRVFHSAMPALYCFVL
jgi:hypothetical protein